MHTKKIAQPVSLTPRKQAVWMWGIRICLVSSNISWSKRSTRVRLSVFQCRRRRSRTSRLLLGNSINYRKVRCLLWFISLLGCGALCSSCGGPESPAAKHESSALETLQAQADSTPIHELEFEQRSGYHFACIPNKGRRTWVMLDARQEPLYKQMPTGPFELTRRQFEQILETRTVTPTVVECLRSHVSEP